MLGTIRPPWGNTLRRVTGRTGETRVSYSPRELNDFIDTLTADAIATQLRERAEWHTARIARLRRDGIGHDASMQAEWHEREADALYALAASTLRGGQ
jgi:hypothetical protein